MCIQEKRYQQVDKDIEREWQVWFRQTFYIPVRGGTNPLLSTTLSGSL
jgi:hypothetical protein